MLHFGVIFPIEAVQHPLLARRPRQVELRISDRGPGIPEGRAESMFAPFQRRGDRDTTSGVGLGLAVARGFCRGRTRR